ncbi:serine hydrolase [Couchioplanes caeruleus]|uniref:Serine hydrolase n=2 Tax=Couchioplanes caeruleus TaxID=56438 RepID=A0A1K0GDH9_9ACTN|nr:serine hydrolase [Couchioplanes caeruleus]OJF10206.1 serine hydrolase [Couchioplanes caeruleus subsp. caeruleus]ROP28830.1 beta-lactamase class A [Couchioplanes caeruleus]
MPFDDDVFAAGGVEGWLHARDIDTGRAMGCRAGEPVVLSSVFKILLALEFARQVASGALDPAERVTVGGGDRLGGWGTGGCADDIELSLRDLAYFTMSVSDNTAADVLLRRVGPDLLPLLAAELGLTRTRVVGGPREMLETMFADVGVADAAGFARVFPTLSDAQVRSLRVFDPQRTTSSTPEEITRLLQLVWRDAAGTPEACAMVRDLMARQMFWTRLAAAFPAGVRVSGKTGTLPGLHMEAGVAEYPDGGRYALAVFVRTHRLDTSRMDVDRLLGRAAAAAVRHLRDE